MFVNMAYNCKVVARAEINTFITTKYTAVKLNYAESSLNYAVFPNFTVLSDAIWFRKLLRIVEQIDVSHYQQ